MDWDNLKEKVFDVVGVGTLAFMLWLFGNFWLRGSFFVGENNIPIRTAETVFLIIGLLIGFERFLRDLNDKGGKVIKRFQQRILKALLF
jgi:hypothetical protein